MNSALKPVLPGVGQPGGQASPAKANVASANHSVALPQGAQNSLHLGAVGQNLSQPSAAAPAAPHPAPPSMAPVSANMAQMAQNMSHHGNFSQNSAPAPAPSPVKPPVSAPLSLVQDKPVEKVAVPTSQPLALTRTPEKKESDPAQANGTMESPKPSVNTPNTLKAQNPEPQKEKQEIAKTSPSTQKPPEKPTSAPTTLQKVKAAVPTSCQPDGPVPPKVPTASEPSEKSPSKPTELKPAIITADVAPIQSDSKPVPESAKDSQASDKSAVPAPKPEAVTQNDKAESSKSEEKKEEPKPEKPAQNSTEEKEKTEEVKGDKPETPKKVETKTEEKEAKPSEKKVEEKVAAEKKAETKTPAKGESKATPKSTLKLATVTPPMRKRRHTSPNKTNDGAKKVEPEGTPDSRSKRSRTQVQLYQSPTPELAMATKLSASAGRATPPKQNEDKLIVFYKNEYLAVRNAEGGFYVCQTMQNVYRNTRKIKIRWLSQDKTADPSGETYKPDFYDVTDMECVLTTLSMSRAGAGGAQALKPAERARAESILQRALRQETAGDLPQPTEGHPDGLDLSLYKDESQLEKKSRKRPASKSSPRAKENANETAKESVTPAKKTRSPPKRSPKSAPKKTPPKSQTNKRGSTPSVAGTSKVGIVQRIYRNTATAVAQKAKAKSTPPPKRTPAKSKDTPVATPTRQGRRTRESKPSPIVPTPSTSTGKATRAPRKPPAHK